MALPVFPIVAGLAGLAALALPKLFKGSPHAMTEAERKAQVSPLYLQYNTIPNYQSIPQKDPNRPSLIQVQRGTDLAMRIRSANPYDGVKPAADYINEESARMTQWLEKELMISWDAIQSGTIVPGAAPYKGDDQVLGPQEELRPGVGLLLDAYWLANQREIHIGAPAQTKIYVEKLILDTKGLSS